MKEDTPDRGGADRNLRAILSAGSAAAVTYLAASVAIKDSQAAIFGVPFKAEAPGWPLVIAVGILGVNWLILLKARGLGSSLRESMRLGVFAAAAGLAVFFVLAHGSSGAVGAGCYAAAALAALGFLFAWSAYGAPCPAATRAVVFMIYVVVCAGLAGTVWEKGLWGAAGGIGKADALLQDEYAAAARQPSEVSSVEGERTGLLAGKGWKFTVEKTVVNNEWRNAAVIAPEGFLSADVSVAEGAELCFSAALRGRLEGAAIVTVLSSGTTQKVWEAKAETLSQEAWTDASVKLSAHGPAKIQFEVNGTGSDGAVMFANPRIEGPRALKTSVILLVQDSLRADRLGAYGYGRGTSPEIDSLCGRAVVFDECLAQAPWTIPSVGTILTSLHPSAHGMVSADKGLSPSLETVAERFQEAGFFTGAIQTNPNLTPEAGLAQGFDEYTALPMRKPTADDKGVYERAGTANGLVLEWLTRHSGHPVFLYVHYMDTHMPYVPPVEFDKFGPDPSSKYDGAAAYFSSETGKLFAELSSRGMLANTIVVLTSDHGEQFWEHGAARHGNCLHAEEINVPLIFWLPGGQGPRRVTQRVGSLDISPTLLDAAGVRKLTNAAGVSLRAALEGGQAGSETQFGELLTYKPTGEYYVSLTRDKWRFIVANPTSDWMTRYELYDIEADKGEYVNVASRNQAVVIGLRNEVMSHLRAQEEGHSRLVPKEFVFPLSEERTRMLRAIGYLAPGREADNGK